MNKLTIHIDVGAAGDACPWIRSPRMRSLRERRKDLKGSGKICNGSERCRCWES